LRKVEDVTTISKSQSLTSVSIKDCTLRVPNETTTLFLLRVILKAIFIQQVREVMTVNQEMTDESSWIWLTSEHMGSPLWSEFANKNHGEAGSSKQCNDQCTDQTAFYLAPIIADFIRNTKRELYDEKLEDALEMLDLEQSKDDDTKTHCNRLNTSHGLLHRGNASNKNGPARVKRRMQWEAPSKPLAVMTLCSCRNEKCKQKSA